MKSTKAIGIDPALRHGAVVQCLFWYLERKSRLDAKQVQVIRQWDRGSENSLAEASTLEDILSTVDFVTEPLKHIDPLPVVIDYSFHSIFWGGRKLAVVKTTFLIASIYQRVLSYGHRPLLLTPKSLRVKMGLPGKTSKEETWSAALNQIVSFDTRLQNWWDNNTTGDVKDALILAAYGAIDELGVSDAIFQPVEPE